MSIQQAERQLTTPQAKPLKTTARCGCSLGNATTQVQSISRRRIFEYGKMIRRFMDIAECWKVCE
jgi:hypothetical protein